MISVEYSKNQNCLHIGELDKAVEINLEKALSSTNNEWEIIGVFKTMREAEDFADEITKQLIKDYEKYGVECPF